MQAGTRAGAAPGGSVVGVVMHRRAQRSGRRKLEVARLVAEGYTNKEIGSRLFLSERTVESHVRNTLMKLGFSRRAQIAARVAASGG